MEDQFLLALTKGGYDINGDNISNDLQVIVPVVIQCFDEKALRYLATKTTLPLVYLMEKNPAGGWTDNFIKDLASFAQGERKREKM